MEDIDVEDIDDILYFLDLVERNNHLQNDKELRAAILSLQCIQIKLDNNSKNKKNTHIIKDDKNKNPGTADVMFK